MDNGKRTGLAPVGGPIKFAKGNPGGPGRPEGTRNRRTEVREAIGGRTMLEKLERGVPDLNLPPAFLRWTRLLRDRNPFVRLAAEKFLFEALHGRPRQQLDVSVTHDRVAAVREAAARIRARRDARLKEVGATLTASPESEEILPGDPHAR